MIATRGMQLGIDFSGGTLIVVKFTQSVDEDGVRTALNSIAGDKVIQPYGDASENEWLIRLPQVEGAGDDLERAGQEVLTALQNANLGQFEVLQRDSVGPVIGRDLQLKGIYATLASIVGITIYIGLRFRFAFAIGAIAATFHDILVTLAFLTFFGYELHRGCALDDHRLLSERHHRHLRPGARELALDATRAS
jgi:preprotein translocase subunit SecF